ncbi:MAG: dihydroorotase [Alistipes sp.]|nr:dihydroorotase [Alistipes sp.]
MSKSKLLIRGGLAVGKGVARTCDVLIEDGIIAAIEGEIEVDEKTEIFDANGAIVTYGLADVHVHLREPGYSEKETIASGTAAAARGGVTTLLSMPNLNPAPDSVENIALQQAMIDEQAIVEVRPYATITTKRIGKEVVDIAALKNLCVGFSDDGSGVQNDAVMLEAMKSIAENDCIMAAHCEDESLLFGGYIHDGEYAAAHNHKGICSQSEWGPIVRDMELVAQSGCRYHICHMSAAGSVEALRAAKAKGLPVSGETGPHYLTMTDMDIQEEGRFKMNPPIRSDVDRDALIEGIKDGTIEVIATDHAPHTAEQKSKGLAGSAMGVVGLETSFAVCYTKLVRTGVITIEKLIELMCDNPRRIFRLGGGLEVGQRADIAVFDTTTPFVVDSSEFLSKGKATPFEGWELVGRCKLTLYGGKTVWRE